MNRTPSAALLVMALAMIASTACAPAPASASGAAAAPGAPATTTLTTTTSLATPRMSDGGAAPAGVPVAAAETPATAGTTIALGTPVAVEGAGASVAGNVVSITAGGVYRLSGALDDGQVIVAAKSSESVQLILDGARIVSSTSAPIYVKSAKRVSVVLAEGSENVLADGSSRATDASGSDEPNAALYSAVDLTIGGDGALAVDARYNDGIASKDDLEIQGGSITVTALADAIRGRDSLTIDGGTIAVKAGKDGLKSSNDEEPEKGGVVVRGGTIQVTADGDGIQAEASVVIGGGAIAITAGGGSGSGAAVADASMKGIKGTTAVAIDGGTITVDATDDAVHSNGSLIVRGGTLNLVSADDGMHADATLEIAGGEISISDSYEGVESARITISDGRVSIRSRDDGLNVAGGNDGSALNGRPGQSGFSAPAGAAVEYRLTISGGQTVIDSAGDGIDANGAIDMTGGLTIVHGPTQNGNGAIDYDRGFTLTGGTLIAAGSAGMAQAPGAASTQPSVSIGFPTVQPAGSLVHIRTEGGEELLTFAPTKAYQSLVVSSPVLKDGSTYIVQAGGSSTGTVTDGLYSGGAYTAGAQVTSFTVAGAVTNAGSVVTGGPGRPRR